MPFPQIIALVVILIGAFFLLGLLLIKKAGKRGCAACGNRGCPMNPAYEGEQETRDAASGLPGEDQDSVEAERTK